MVKPMPPQHKPHDPRVDRAALIPAYVISYTDSAFTMPHAVVSPDEPVFDPDAFTFVGKEMDGLESRRHRAIALLDGPAGPGFRYDPNAHNQICIGFARRSRVHTLEISTEWFTGNQVKEVTVYLCDRGTGSETCLLNREPLEPDHKHFFAVADEAATDLRIDCYPDGGISRIRCYGAAAEQLPTRDNVLADARISHVSNTHYGTPADALAGARQVAYMFGWESGRSGFGEQALFTLSCPCTIEDIAVDSYRHVLNTPLCCYAFGFAGTDEQLANALARAPVWKVRFASGREIVPDNLREYIEGKRYLDDNGGVYEPFTIALQHAPDSPWRPMIVHMPLTADALNRFENLDERGPFTHILFLHFPNGGIHGLRMHGVRHPESSVHGESGRSSSS